MSRRLLSPDKYQPGRRVYVGDLDVFGTLTVPHLTTQWIVICEMPMPDYIYTVTEKSTLYDDAIGDRDRHVAESSAFIAALPLNEFVRHLLTIADREPFYRMFLHDAIRRLLAPGLAAKNPSSPGT